MTWDEYQALDAVNASTLKWMRKSPKHYQWRLSHPPEETDAMKLGRAAHCVVFEPDRFPIEYVFWTGGVRRGKDWDAFREAHVGQTILRLDEYAACLSMRDAVRAHPEAAPLLATGQAEHVIQWTDADTGLACKARLDFLGPELLDLKTTNDLERGRFESTSARIGHHVQLAFYGMGLRALGLDRPITVIGVESQEPYDVGVFSLTEDVLWAGEEEARALLAKVAAGRFSGQWPGRYPTRTDFSLPGWAFPQPLAGDDDEDVAGILSGPGEAA